MKVSLKKIWKVASRVVLYLGAVSFIVVAVIFGIAYFEYRSECYTDEWLSDAVLSKYYENRDEFMIYNRKTEKYTLKDVQWVVKAARHDSLTVYSRDGKRGFLNVNTGEVVIPEQYSRAWVFSEGLAAVEIDGKIGFIDSDNRTVLPFVYDYSYRNGMPIDYLFRNGYCTMTDARGACGLIDKSGKWVIDPVYDCIWPPHYGKYRIVKDGDKYGLLGGNLEFIFPIEYDYIEFSNEKGVLLTKDGYQWRSDYDGKVLDPFVYSSTDYVYYVTGNRCTDEYFSDEYRPEESSYTLSDYMKYWIYGNCGIIRKKDGKVIIPAVYEQINMLSPTLFEVLDGKDGIRLLMDNNGNVVK